MMKNILLSQTKNKNELTEKTKNCTYALIVNNDVYNPIAGHIKYHDNYVQSTSQKVFRKDKTQSTSCL